MTRPQTSHDDALDAAARRAHAASLEHLSPRVQAQLAQRRRTALSGARPRPMLRGLQWLAGGVAAAGALALGLQLMRAPDVPLATAPVASTPVAIATPAAEARPAEAPALPQGATPAPVATAAVVPDPIVLADAADAATAVDADEILAAAVDASAEAVDAVAAEFALEDDPDFYLWLASVDASALPPEIP